MRNAKDFWHKNDGIITFHAEQSFKENEVTPEMQKEVKKMEVYSEQIRFMCKYKLETTDAVEEQKIKNLEKNK